MTFGQFIRGTDKSGEYCCNRQFEWTMAIVMVLVGSALLIWPNTLIFSNLSKMLQFVNEFTIACVLSTVGLARIIALAANGNLPWTGPAIRATCAIVNALFLSQMALALAFNGPDPLPGTFIFFPFALSELLSSFRAACDVRERRRGV